MSPQAKFSRGKDAKGRYKSHRLPIDEQEIELVRAEQILRRLLVETNPLFQKILEQEMRFEVDVLKR